MIESEKLNSLFELADLLSHQHDFDESLRLITQKVLGLFNAETASIVLVNPNTQHTQKTIMRQGGAVSEKQLHLLQTNIVGWINKNRTHFLSGGIQTDARFRKDLFQNCHINSALSVPLFFQGVMIGFIILLDERKDQFNADDLVLLERCALVCAPALGSSPRIEDYFKTIMPQAALLKKYEACGLLGKSSAFIELLKSVEAAAFCDVRVLLEGHSGTGKELIARAIHTHSSRANHPFVAVDCGAIPENLVESELFGHAKGAFTGATQDRKGLFEEAHLGTLFMDEIENLPLHMQAKLLRVVQEGEIRIVGSNRVRKVDVRIIAASSNSLQAMVENGAFREDLYYRLYVYPICIPTLRERQDDIFLLAHFFLKRCAEQQEKKVTSIDNSILKFLKTRTWKGNIRELQNFIERLVTLVPADHKMISRTDLPPKLLQELKTDAVAGAGSVKQAVADYEKQLYLNALQSHDWNQSQTARFLKMSERMLRYNMQRLGISKSENE